jgi:hypothetical protein
MEQQIKERPEVSEITWIDDAFRVEQTRMTKEIVIDMSRWHLKCEQEGTLEQYTRVVGDAFVGGKL